MIGQTITSDHYGKLRIMGELPGCNQGGEGVVYETDNAGLLIKEFRPQLDPVTPPPIAQQLQAQKTIAYRTFVNLRFTAQTELQCLPLEYLNLPSNRPGYIMQRGEGELLADALDKTIPRLPIESRLSIARSLARAVHVLHARQVVHADLKPENFIVSQGSNTYRLLMLDIDGGGYHGPEAAQTFTRFAPTVVPWQPYRSPELVYQSWDTLWETPSVGKEPDLWALAVLLFVIIVDTDGPFPTRKQRMDIAHFNYSPYDRRDFAGSSPWPQTWQAKLMLNREIPPSIVEAFTTTFDGNRCVTGGGKPRLRAQEWERRLEIALEPNAQHSPVIPASPVGLSVSSPRVTIRLGGSVPIPTSVPSLSRPAPKPIPMGSAIPATMTIASSPPSTTRTIQTWHVGAMARLVILSAIIGALPLLTQIPAFRTLGLPLVGWPAGALTIAFAAAVGWFLGLLARKHALNWLLFALGAVASLVGVCIYRPALAPYVLLTELLLVFVRLAKL